MPSPERKTSSTPRPFSSQILADHSPFVRYGIAVLAAAAGLAIDHILAGVLFSNFAFIPLAAVAAAAITAGNGPGLAASLLSVLGLYHFFWAPVIGHWNAWGVAAAYGPVVLMVSYGGGTIRSLYKSSLEHAAELGAAVEGRNELLSVLSQDFRTHLSTLKLNHSVLRILIESLGPQLDKDFLQRFNHADREISRLTSLIDNVVEASKRRSGRQVVNRQEFDLSDLAREIADSVSIQAEQAKCDLNVDLQPAVGRWDRFRLERMLLNLLTNAIEYAAGSEISLRTLTADGRAKLIVEDHGPGIPEDKLHTLFQPPDHSPRSTDVADGMGLGLYVVKKIVDAHGGTIDAQSRLGGGSTFTVELPLLVA